MRDRQTDSWWSLMQSKAIGGGMEGQSLTELNSGEKVTWGEWRRRHPDTLVLSVDGHEHEENNPYDGYFKADGTFRGIQVEDDRLPPKTPVVALWIGDDPFAVTHEVAEGGAMLPIEGDRILVLYREPGASVFASTRVALLPAALVGDEKDARAVLDAHGDETETTNAFDTYWYTWVLVNPETQLLGTD